LTKREKLSLADHCTIETLKKKFVLWCFDKYLVMNSDEH